MSNRKPLLETIEKGDVVDFTQERLGRVCNKLGDKISVCPHCKRLGMRKVLLNEKVRFVHIGRREATFTIPIDACTMWARTEFKLRFGTDTLHPKFRRPGDEDETVEEIR